MATRRSNGASGASRWGRFTGGAGWTRVRIVGWASLQAERSATTMVRWVRAFATTTGPDSIRNAIKPPQERRDPLSLTKLEDRRVPNLQRTFVSAPGDRPSRHERFPCRPRIVRRQLTLSRTPFGGTGSERPPVIRSRWQGQAWEPWRSINMRFWCGKTAVRSPNVA